jgi:hypothetical protein
MPSVCHVRGFVSSLVVATSIAACGGSTSSLTGPSGSPAASGATIAGTLAGSSRASAQIQAGQSLIGPLSQLQVTVVGTGPTVPLDDSGNFLLVNVPSGSLELLFSGQGVYARTSVPHVGDGEYVQLRIALESDSAATVLSDDRSAATLALCHVTGNGSFRLVHVNPSAEPAHMGHGDGLPGGPLPGAETTNTLGTLCETARVELVKSTNGENANRAPGPEVAVGSTVTWEYVVRNTGGVELTNIVVQDDQLGAITCPQTTLAPSASMTCTATGLATAGQYMNLGTVTAASLLGPASDTDPSHYFGETAEQQQQGSSVKVDLCHRTGNGRYHLISVSIDAQPAHIAHGDGVPNGEVPGQPSLTFGPACELPVSPGQ